MVWDVAHPSTASIRSVSAPTSIRILDQPGRPASWPWRTESPAVNLLDLERLHERPPGHRGRAVAVATVAFSPDGTTARDSQPWAAGLELFDVQSGQTPRPVRRPGQSWGRSRWPSGREAIGWRWPSVTRSTWSASARSLDGDDRSRRAWGRSAGSRSAPTSGCSPWAATTGRSRCGTSGRAGRSRLSSGHRSRRLRPGVRARAGRPAAGLGRRRRLDPDLGPRGRRPAAAHPGRREPGRLRGGGPARRPADRHGRRGPAWCTPGTPPRDDPTSVRSTTAARSRPWPMTRPARPWPPAAWIARSGSGPPHPAGRRLGPLAHPYSDHLPRLQPRRPAPGGRRRRERQGRHGADLGRIERQGPRHGSTARAE